MRFLQFTRSLLGMAYLLLLQQANVARSLHMGRHIGKEISRSKSSSLGSSADAGERASIMGKTLGISGTARHIFLCADQTKPKCCSTVAGLESWDFLKARLKELKLVGPNALVMRTKANCLQVIYSLIKMCSLLIALHKCTLKYLLQKKLFSRFDIWDCSLMN